MGELGGKRHKRRSDRYNQKKQNIDIDIGIYCLSLGVFLLTTKIEFVPVLSVNTYHEFQLFHKGASEVSEQASEANEQAN